MTVEESNSKNDLSLEMTLGLQGGMKEDEMTTSAGSAEDRIGGVQLSDDTEHIRREINNTSRRLEEKWKVYCRNFK